MKLGEVELELIQKNTSISISKFIPDYYADVDKSPLRGFTKIAFLVNDVETLSEKLKQKEVKFYANLFRDDEFELWSFIIEDLDGNLLQFNQKIINGY